MAGRLDPPHDRVVLTSDELRTVERLERAFDEQTVARDGAEAGRRLRSRGLSGWALTLLRFVGAVPWLVPTGVIVTVAALFFSLAAGILGALLTGVALAASFRWGRLRALRRGRRNA